MDTPISALGGAGDLQWKEQMLSGKTSEKEQVEQLAKQFEGILVRQFLDQALEPMDKESGIFGAKSSPMYDHLIKDTLATSITQNANFGFSNVLQAQLYPESQNPSEEVNPNE